eukprot:15344792-Ditylum_brightwellii.AAC.1
MFSVCRNKKAERVTDAYVDDTGNTYVDEEKEVEETSESIRNSLRHIAITWEQLLFGSGGRLCPKRTFWWLIWWSWIDGKVTMTTKEELDMNIQIKFGYNQSETTIKRRTVMKQYRIWECWLVLREIFVWSFNSKRNTSSRSHTDSSVPLFLQKCLLVIPKHMVAFNAISACYHVIYKKQCIQIMKPFVYAILSKLGLNRHTARTIIFGSVRYSGFQLAHLFLEQGYLSIKHFIGHVQEET